MTASIVNLNKYRKAKARTEDEKQAKENRAKFGRTKLERQAGESDRERRDTALDGAQRVSDDDDLDPGAVS